MQAYFSLEIICYQRKNFQKIVLIIPRLYLPNLPRLRNVLPERIITLKFFYGFVYGVVFI